MDTIRSLAALMEDPDRLCETQSALAAEPLASEEPKIALLEGVRSALRGFATATCPGRAAVGRGIEGLDGGAWGRQRRKTDA